jgi:putative cell wall-binding protein
VAEKLGKDHADTCIIATSWKFQDALSISPYAYAYKVPIFLCDSGTNALAEATLQMIRNMGFSKAVIVGGPVAVDSGVEVQLKKSGISSVQRVYGQTEYETSQAIAEWELA